MDVNASKAEEGLSMIRKGRGGLESKIREGGGRVPVQEGGGGRPREENEEDEERRLFNVNREGSSRGGFG